MGDSARCQRRFRGQHGRCAGSLPEAARSGVPRGLPGRDEQSNLSPRRACRSRQNQDARAHDYEYERNGTANLFMMFAPLEGWRHVEVTDRHTAVDYAHVLKICPTRIFQRRTKIILVQDNLNTHKPASLYEAFPAAEARRLVERFEWHFTPKHGSWLNMAKSELSVLWQAVPGSAHRRQADPDRGSRRLGGQPQQANIPKPIGSSPPLTPALSCAASTQRYERLGHWP